MTQKVEKIENSKATGININGKSINISSNDIVNTNNTIIPIYCRRWNMLSCLLSILAIAASLGAWISLYLTMLKDKDTISSDAFIGAIGGLMGICSTIIVGFQIYNSIDINQKIKEQNSLYDKRFDELTAKQTHLDSLILQINQELTNAEANSQKELLSLQSYVRIVQAITISENQPFAAFYSWYYAMKYAVESNNSKAIHIVMENLKNLHRDIKVFDQQTLYDYISNENQDNIKDIMAINIKNMPMSDEYKEIQDKFEYIVSDIIQLIKKNHDTYN